eukprot:2043458-Amphidinium_carterae.7
MHGFKKCTIMSGGIGLRVNFIICDVPCPIIGNSTVEEHQRSAVVKPPPHKSWIMSLHSAHGTRMVKIGKHYLVQTSKSQINAFPQSEPHSDICGSDMVTRGEESDQQHADGVASSFNISAAER